MKRTFAISDVHGCLDEFNKLIVECGYNYIFDQLILLGDYVDRGFKSKETVDRVIELVNDGAIALKGNHDFMFVDALNGNNDDVFLHNGGITTIESYVGMNWFDDDQGFNFKRYVDAKDFIKKHFSHHVEFLQSLPYHYEDDNHIYVHAGLDPFYEDWSVQPYDNFIWIRDMFLRNKTTVGKMVVFGHTPTVNLHDSAEVWFQEDKIGIDGGCVFGYQMNCLEMIEDTYNTYSVESKRKR